MKLEIGDICWLEDVYPTTLETEIRPVVIYASEDGVYIIASFATVTGEGIKDSSNKYDKWKLPIFGWRDAGLDKESYIKVNNIATIDAGELNEQDYIGKLTRSDLINALKKID